MEKNHYICIPAIDIDSVLKIVRFIDSEVIDDDSDDDGYDSDNENDFHILFFSKCI